MAKAITNHLSTLVSNIMNVVNRYGFDGVDIDWEGYNVSADGLNQTALASALRNQLGTKILTVAVTVDNSAWSGANHSFFDRINLMTYDLGNPQWNPYSWFNAPLYGPRDHAVWSIDMAVSRYTDAGVPASKLSIGIPFYGWVWTGGGITGPRQNWSATPELDQTYYQDIQPTITPQNYRWDSTAQVPFLSISGGTAATAKFVTYDDAQSVVAKVSYAKTKGLGGWIIWELSADYLPGQTPDQPLLTAIRNLLVRITNAASFSSTTGGVAPGSLASAFAATGVSQNFSASSLPLPTTLGGVTLQIGGSLNFDSTTANWTYSPTGSIRAPLLFVGPNQINFQIPPGIAPSNAVPALLTKPDGATLLTTLNIIATAPGIFSVLQNGQGQAVMLNQDDSQNLGTNPAARGSVIQIFATGGGETTPSLLPGAAADARGNPLAFTNVQPTVTIGGVTAKVLFSGMAPGWVGLWQINAEVPERVAPGNNVPLTVSAGEITSNTVTIAVQ